MELKKIKKPKPEKKSTEKKKEKSTENNTANKKIPFNLKNPEKKTEL